MVLYGPVSVLPKPFVSRDVAESVLVSVIEGRAEGINKSCAILEWTGRENDVLLVFDRRTIMSPR